MKNFWKDVLKRMAVTLVSTLLFVVISLFLFEAIFSSLFDQKKREAIPGSFLVLDLSMNLTDRPTELTFEDLTREAITEQSKAPHFHLKEVLNSLEKAALDSKIKGIFIEGGFLPDGYGCGYAAIQELVSGLQKFKDSGKKITGFFSDPSQLDYLVYSMCDELHMNPSGTLILNGLANEQVFMGEALERYGVGVQVIRVGEFKGAVEPFIATGFSKENRLQISRLLNVRWDDYLHSVSLNRGIEKSDLILDLNKTFIFSPEQCLEKGFADFITPYGDMLDSLLLNGVKDDDSGEFARIDLIDYVDRPNLSEGDQSISKTDQKKVAVVYVEGTIVDGWVDDGFSIGGDEIAERIREISRDSDYKAIILRVNSPGGSVSGSDTILNEISRSRAKGLPVVVSMGSVAASGGYWIAMDSDRVFASEQTVTGSIGVFGLLPNLKGLMGNFSLYWDTVKTNDSSDIMSVSRPKSDRELAIVQKYVDRIYERFISLVSESRDLNASEVDQIAQGRIWMGQEAYELGLVDELGGLQNAITYGAELAGVDDYKIDEFPAAKDPMEAISELFKIKSLQRAHKHKDSPFMSSLKEMRTFITQLKNLNDPRSSYIILPWYQNSFGFPR